MEKKKKIIEKQKQRTYILFLEKQVNSENYKNNVSKEEYEKTKKKLSKERLKVRLGF